MKQLALILLAALSFEAPAAAADVVVIVNKGNDVPVSKRLVSSLYNGEARMWPRGLPVALLDLPADNPARAAFCKLYLGKTVQQTKALWMQNELTGKAIPPRQVASDEEMKKAVSQSRIAIGYIDAANVDDTVKIVAKD